MLVQKVHGAAQAQVIPDPWEGQDRLLVLMLNHHTGTLGCLNGVLDIRCVGSIQCGGPLPTSTPKVMTLQPKRVLLPAPAFGGYHCSLGPLAMG